MNLLVFKSCCHGASTKSPVDRVPVRVFLWATELVTRYYDIALLTYDELHKIDQDECIILFQGHNPIWAKKYPHTLHPDAKTCRTIYPQDIPDIQDTQARLKRKEDELRRIEAWHKSHGPEPTVDERKRMYEGKCESDAEETMRGKIWDKTRERMLEMAQKLDGTASVQAHTQKRQKIVIREGEEFTLEPELVDCFVIDGSEAAASPVISSDVETQLQNDRGHIDTATDPFPSKNSSKTTMEEVALDGGLEVITDIPNFADEHDDLIPIENSEDAGSNSTSINKVKTGTRPSDTGDRVEKKDGKTSISVQQPPGAVTGVRKNQMRFNVYHPPQQTAAQKPRAGNVPPGKRKRTTI